MPGLTSSLQIGLSGLQVAQSAISVVGHNIANVNTPGFSRQQALITSNGAVSYGNLQFGNGAGLSQVQGVRDRFLELQIHNALSRQQGGNTRSAGLQPLASAFQDQGDDGMSAQLQKFFQAFQEVAARPEDVAIRTNLLGRAQNLIDGMKTRYTLLDEQRATLNQAIPSYLTEVNSLATQIAQLNNRIAGETVPGGDSDARDQRQALASKISEIAGLQVYLDDHDQLNLSFADGSLLVNGSQVQQLQAVQDPANSNFYRVEVTTGLSSTTDVTASIKEGKLGGTLDLRDNYIPGYQRKMDEVAAGIAGQVNLLHAGGYGLNNTTGDYFFQGADPINAATGLPTTITAASHYKNMVYSLSINSALIADPNRIAASSALNAPGNNTNALAMARLETLGNSVDSTGSGSGNTGPFSTVLARLVNAIGTDAQVFQARSTTDENLLTALQNQRDQVSGVDLDEEAAKLMSLQRGYSASARFLSVINQLTDQLVNNTLT